MEWTARAPFRRRGPGLGELNVHIPPAPCPCANCAGRHITPSLLVRPSVSPLRRKRASSAHGVLDVKVPCGEARYAAVFLFLLAPRERCLPAECRSAMSSPRDSNASHRSLSCLSLSPDPSPDVSCCGTEMRNGLRHDADPILLASPGRSKSPLEWLCGWRCGVSFRSGHFLGLQPGPLAALLIFREYPNVTDPAVAPGVSANFPRNRFVEGWRWA